MSRTKRYPQKMGDMQEYKFKPCCLHVLVATQFLSSSIVDFLCHCVCFSFPSTVPHGCTALWSSSIHLFAVYASKLQTAIFLLHLPKAFPECWRRGKVSLHSQPLQCQHELNELRLIHPNQVRMRLHKRPGAMASLLNDEERLLSFVRTFDNRRSGKNRPRFDVQVRWISDALIGHKNVGLSSGKIFGNVCYDFLIGRQRPVSFVAGACLHHCCWNAGGVDIVEEGEE